MRWRVEWRAVEYFVLAPKVKTLGLHFFGNVVSFVNIVL